MLGAQPLDKRNSRALSCRFFLRAPAPDPTLPNLCVHAVQSGATRFASLQHEFLAQVQTTSTTLPGAGTAVRAHPAQAQPARGDQEPVKDAWTAGLRLKKLWMPVGKSAQTQQRHAAIRAAVFRKSLREGWLVFPQVRWTTTSMAPAQVGHAKDQRCVPRSPQWCWHTTPCARALRQGRLAAQRHVWLC